MKNFVKFCLILPLIACVNTVEEPQEVETSDKTETPVREHWRGVISLNDSIDLPFNFLWENISGAYEMTILNGEERISTTDIKVEGDSIRIGMPVFSNYLVFHYNEGAMNGYYVNPDASNYRLPFRAVANDSTRFEVSEKNCCDINEKWAVKFEPGTEGEYPAIAYFQQEGSVVNGTFMTETGDYRYLHGVLNGEILRLSAFDGSHLFYFKARIINGQQMEGKFYSGRSYMANWNAYRDDDFQLRNANELTFLKKGEKKLSFSLKDLQGNTVSLQDEKYRNKPVILQIMGSWCPNCMDESRYLKNVYNQYKNEGLEIIGIAFERAKSKEIAVERASKMKKDLELPYPVVMGGSSREDNPTEIFPQLNHIMSYPTTIYLNRNHEVVNIHTGFNGPGTPVYDKFVAENKLLLEKIIEPQKKS